MQPQPIQPQSGHLDSDSVTRVLHEINDHRARRLLPAALASLVFILVEIYLVLIGMTHSFHPLSHLGDINLHETTTIILCGVAVLAVILPLWFGRLLLRHRLSDIYMAKIQAPIVQAISRSGTARFKAEQDIAMEPLFSSGLVPRYRPKRIELCGTQVVNGLSDGHPYTFCHLAYSRVRVPFFEYYTTEFQGLYLQIDDLDQAVQPIRFFSDDPRHSTAVSPAVQTILDTLHDLVHDYRGLQSYAMAHIGTTCLILIAVPGHLFQVPIDKPLTFDQVQTDMAFHSRMRELNKIVTRALSQRT